MCGQEAVGSPYTGGRDGVGMSVEPAGVEAGVGGT